jgi:hypothetical protein
MARLALFCVKQFRMGRYSAVHGLRSGSSARDGELRDECLNGEISHSLREAQVVIAKWRVIYNALRPRSALARSRRRR